MTLSPRHRLSWLGLFLAASLAAAAMTGLDESGPDPADPKETAPKPGKETPDGTLRIAKLDPAAIVQREAVESIKVDIFEARSWQPAPPPQVAAAPAPRPKPVAPPLPFTYAGQLGDPATGKIIVYLSTPEQTHTVTLGEIINDRYKLEAIGEGQLTFVYLPMNTKQFLAIPR